jgi:hypothetical protein
MVAGYNISLELGGSGKTVLGRTQEDLTIAAVTKTSITKDDAGVQQEKVVRHDVTFKVTALLSFNGSSASTLDRDDVIALALATDSAAVVSVSYIVTGGDTYTGSGIITGYSESSSAEVDSDTTLSLDVRIIGAFTKAA